MSNLEVRHPERIAQCPRRGRKGQTALRTCLLRPCAGSGWGALRWGGGRRVVARPLLRRAPPTSGHRIPRILSRGSGLRFQSGEICSTSAFEEPPISLQRLFASSFYTFSFGVLSTLRKGGRERSPFFRPPSEQHREAAGCRRAGLALRNSGGLCSPQLFPDHLTRQLLERRCC